MCISWMGAAGPGGLILVVEEEENEEGCWCCYPCGCSWWCSAVSLGPLVVVLCDWLLGGKSYRFLCVSKNIVCKFSFCCAHPLPSPPYSSDCIA